MRSYIQTATKAATHPVRSLILKSLKDSPKSTLELEAITGEPRYNLYHHLNFLEKAGLVAWDLKDNKTKIYFLPELKRPEAAIVVFDQGDIQSRPEQFRAMIDAVSAMEGKPIPHRERITKAEICFHYEWKRRHVGRDEK